MGVVASTTVENSWNVRLVFPTGSPKARGRTFEHPVMRSEDEWLKVINLVQVKPKSGFPTFSKNMEPEPAFRVSEATYLAAQLATHFQEASPREWVAFYLQEPHGSGVTEVTTGAFFVDEKKLHVFFAHYRHLVTIPILLTEVYQHPLNSTGRIMYDIVPNQAWTVVKDSNWGFVKPLAASTVEAELNQDPLAIGMGLEEQLRMLKQMREQNLIDEAGYRRKRDELLKGL
jgi:hypothetical protein